MNRCGATAGLLAVLAVAAGPEAVRAGAWVVKSQEAVHNFQAGMKEKDAAKMWTWVEEGTQKELQAAADLAREAYLKASPEQRDRTAAALGLPAATLEKLSGPDLLLSKPFLEKYGFLLAAGEKLTAAMAGAKTRVEIGLTAGGVDYKLVLLAKSREALDYKLVLPLPAAISASGNTK